MLHLTKVRELAAWFHASHNLSCSISTQQLNVDFPDLFGINLLRIRGMRWTSLGGARYSMQHDTWAGMRIGFFFCIYFLPASMCWLLQRSCHSHAYLALYLQHLGDFAFCLWHLQAQVAWYLQHFARYSQVIVCPEE